ncbi:hypothetical protein O181_067692 [Austropuccinia psidii MF-1]|uniref:Uncharacterized protein n=1 Tax=Austropuccinia psidii MF-1 TaxID=1389203 RepID=A0A9Q3EXW0_9BASI|nr:hypothetical protein [Austropuccinia psidii MF-1]
MSTHDPVLSEGTENTAHPPQKAPGGQVVSLLGYPCGPLWVGDYFLILHRQGNRMSVNSQCQRLANVVPRRRPSPYHRNDQVAHAIHMSSSWSIEVKKLDSFRTYKGKRSQPPTQWSLPWIQRLSTSSHSRRLCLQVHCRQEVIATKN